MGSHSFSAKYKWVFHSSEINIINIIIIISNIHSNFLFCKMIKK